MDVKAAEFAKYAANAMLATRISFMNELAGLGRPGGRGHRAGATRHGSDRRIGYSFLYAGTGYGGSCFLKDLRALIHTAGENGHRLRLLEAVEAVNVAQKNVLVEKITARFGQSLKAGALPAELHRWRVLDVGCNAGFYSFELAVKSVLMGNSNGGLGKKAKRTREPQTAGFRSAPKRRRRGIGKESDCNLETDNPCIS